MLDYESATVDAAAKYLVPKAFAFGVIHSFNQDCSPSAIFLSSQWKTARLCNPCRLR